MGWGASSKAHLQPPLGQIRAGTTCPLPESRGVGPWRSFLAFCNWLKAAVGSLAGALQLS